MKDTPEIVGREKELGRLREGFEDALRGRGGTFLISGEAGIGKTRLTNEMISIAEGSGARTLRGWCLAESLEPLMPMRTAFREAGLDHLFTGEKPPNLLSLYLISRSGMLISKAQREESGIEPDIFAGMLTAVSSFVKDSLGDMGSGAGLNVMGYNDYRIIMEHSENCSLAAVISGRENEFFLDDMKRTLARIEGEYSRAIREWSGNLKEVYGTERYLLAMLSSGKYEGKFLADDPRILQENLFDNVLLAIQRLSGEHPVILFIDDLQWCDPTSLNLLHYLSRNIRANRILILGTYRPEDIQQNRDGTPHPLERTMQNMSRESLFADIPLTRLSMADTRRLASEILSPNALEPGFFERVHRETEGTPFYILEVLKLLADEGALRLGGDGTWNLTADPDELAIPSKIYDVVKRRLDRLTDDQRGMLEIGSVIGANFDSDTVGRVLELNRIQLLKGLSGIEKGHKLIHSSGKSYAFDHAKVREVLYNGIMEELKQEYHRMVGDAILARNADSPDSVLTELAYHFHMARDPRAGELLAKTGDIAKSRYSNAEAVRSYLAALEHLTDRNALAGVHQNLADVYELLGKYEDSISHFTRAIELEPDPVRRANLHSRLALVYDQIGKYEESIAECRKGLGLMEGRGGMGRATLLNNLGWIYLKSGDNANSGKYMEECLAIALPLMSSGTDESGDHPENPQHDDAEMGRLASTMNNLGLVFQYKGELARALELYNMALGLFTRIERKSDISTALINIGNTYLDMGDLSRALENHENALAINNSIGARSSIAHSLTCLGYTYYDMGEYARAIEFQDRSIVICSETGYRSLQIYNHYGIAEARAGLGNGAESLRSAEEAVSISREMSFPLGEAMGHRALGMARSVLGDPDAAAREFTRSIEILDNIGEMRELARTRYEFGILCFVMGDTVNAAELLKSALEAYEAMGMLLWVERTKKALENTD